ncbi:MAG: hypothetical protein LBG95_06730 [Treponema sp.]|jgi:hypothetical protein|nr:hypothetical protein [Treponema sp.]
MKKIVICLFLIMVFNGIAFSQNSDDWNRGGIVRFKPAATFLGLFSGVVEVVADWAPYITPNFGIPIEIDVGSTFGGIFVFGIMAGIEGVPLWHKEKNGLFLTAMAGPIFIMNDDSDVSFGAKADIGYQLVTGGGFVFTPAIGVKYYGFSGFSFDLMLDIGFAYRKKATKRHITGV